MTLVRFVSSLALFLATLAPTDLQANPPAVPPSDKVSYSRDILPLFRAHCLGCHQPAKAGGGYIMTAHDLLLAKGDSDRPGVLPGKPLESELLARITPGKSDKELMPKGKPELPAADRARIEKWIAQGAMDDTPASARVRIDADHPPTYASAPVITSAEFSPDNKWLAVAGYHEVLLYNADGTKLEGRLIGMSERIQSLAFSPDSTRLAVAGGSPGRFGEVQIWDLAKKRLRQSQTFTADTLYGVSWSPDGTKVAFGCSDNTLRAIDAATGKQVLFQGAHNDWVLDTTFSREGDYLVSVSRDMTIKLTEVDTQRFIDNITSITPGVLKGGLQAVARRPMKEKKLVPKTNLEVGDVTRDKAYDELLIGGSDGTPRLYKMHREAKRVIGDDANKVREYEAMPGRLFALAFSPDGNQFAVGGSADGKGEVRVYATNDGKRLTTLEGQSGAIYTLAYRPDGKVIASAGFDGRVRLNDTATGKLIRDFSAIPSATAGK